MPPTAYPLSHTFPVCRCTNVSHLFLFLFQALAQALPKTYKQLLTLLKDEGVASWDSEVEYEMCSCGLIYRGRYRRDDRCSDCHNPR